MSFQNRVWVACLAAAAMTGCPTSEGDVDAGQDAGDTVDAGGTDGGGGGTDAGAPDAGSGGKCEGLFDSNNPFGHACVTDDDCADALCFHSPSYDNYCTRACSTSGTNACPTGYSCLAEGSGQVVDICVLDEEERPLPGDGSVENGFPCNWDEDCKSGDCAYSFAGDVAFGRCAEGCETPGSDECGDCFACIEGGLSNRCERVGDGKVGDDCATDGDCASGLCLALGEASICSQACGGENDVACGTGTQCIATTGATTTYCIPTARIGTAGNGDACSFGFECTTGLRCITADSTSTCQAARTQGQTCLLNGDCAEGLRCAPAATTGADRTCEPPGAIGALCTGTTAGQCATGLDCKPFSREASFCTKPCTAGCGTGNSCAAPGMDTTLELFKGIDTVPDGEIAYSDDVDLNNGNLFSAIRDEAVEAGTYFVRVKAFGSDLGGYTLAIRTATGGTPAQVTELAESPTDTNDNDDVDFAQLLIGVPVDVKGRLEAAGDNDYFQFELAAAATLSLKLTIGEGTFCLPTAKVGTAGGGETCKFDAACSSSQCDLGIDACIQFCTTDESCGNGKKCRVTSAGSTCVDAALVGVTARGEDCDYAWECADGLCESWDFATFCTSACGVGAANPTCPIGYECGEISSERFVCLPEGDRATPFNQACTLQSDCVTGLNCLDGTCTKACTADNACPGFDFPSNLPSGDVSCKACTDDTDCGANGFCGRYPGTTNLVCVQLASASSDCAAGFDYIEDFFSGTAYCVASQGSCNPSSCVAPTPGAGVCAVPTRELRDTCTSAAECKSEVCGGGFCTKGCAADGDCECPGNDFVCAGNQCGASGALLRSDVEPNNQPTQAPVLTTGTFRILGTIVETATGAGDLDLWKLTLPIGASVSATTRGPCGAGNLDTFVAVVTDQLDIVATDTLPNDTYGAVTFTADATNNGTLYLAVADENYLLGGNATQGSYVLEVTVTVP